MDSMVTRQNEKMRDSKARKKWEDSVRLGEVVRQVLTRIESHCPQQNEPLFALGNPKGRHSAGVLAALAGFYGQKRTKKARKGVIAR
jgi:hypothetical protein